MIVKFLEEHWDNCVRELHSDEGYNIALPRPYSTPTETDHFCNLYYWDTYFTNIGLILSGRAEQARNNTDNMIYLVEKYGYMPNANSTHMLNRSQPPFLSLMIKDVFDIFGDKEWLRRAYAALCKEYDFWMKNRITPTGLNRYGGDITGKNHEASAEYYFNRIGKRLDGESAEQIDANLTAECESGWDCSPRFNDRATEFIPIDLNCLLFALESNMICFSEVLQNGEHSIWIKRVENRKRLMKRYLWNEERGAYLDRNYVTGEWGPVFSAASFFALMCCVADRREADSIKKLLPLIEMKHGISACEKNEVNGSYQWNYPNCWAPVQYGVIKGLMNYGYFSDAKRLGIQYCNLLERCYNITGNLWEKYNAVEGSVNVTNEYEMPPMLGWTAGVYLYCLRNFK